VISKIKKTQKFIVYCNSIPSDDCEAVILQLFFRARTSQMGPKYGKFSKVSVRELSVTINDILSAV